jgi:UDP-N-acetylmuramyl pentapeptide phosphotransferase/UDP-N-acetylglucosamine-1-phosphate transferase
MIIDNGLIIDNFHGIFGLFEISRIYAHIMTIFIIVAIINAINFIDGIDGLAISVTLFFIILFESLSAEVTPYIKMSLIVLFSIFPLYIFNFKKTKKVFIGDSGSLFLGGIISTYVIYILSNDYIIVKRFDVHKVIFVFSLLSYPIVDLIRVFFLRVIKGDSPFKADKNHIHHILLKKINNHKVVSLIIIVCSISVFLTIQLLVNFI